MRLIPIQEGASGSSFAVAVYSLLPSAQWPLNRHGNNPWCLSSVSGWAQQRERCTGQLLL